MPHWMAFANKLLAKDFCARILAIPQFNKGERA